MHNSVIIRCCVRLKIFNLHPFYLNNVSSHFPLSLISERNKSFISIKILDTHDTQDYLVVWVQKHRLRQIQLDWGFISRSESDFYEYFKTFLKPMV
ncbi:hypothetical protein RCL_jg24760.t1 [Rhizophagus clarus]|uniref:Uncharacterized protein n=1 Tax=Rhizophagus clarus TaxID=94130 RepID=A0A8H3LE07_9GLOM|nr:hypothetical protein RCL_jg24760.t1 [Rhizophagus clarus]